MEHTYSLLDNPTPRSDHKFLSFLATFFFTFTYNMCIQDNEQVVCFYDMYYVVYLSLCTYNSTLGMCELTMWVSNSSFPLTATE